MRSLRILLQAHRSYFEKVVLAPLQQLLLGERKFFAFERFSFSEGQPISSSPVVKKCSVLFVDEVVDSK